MALLETMGLTRRFGGLVAVNDVSLAVGQGEIRGLIGPNGAGKTTLFNVISGALRPTSGSVRFDGADVTGRPLHALARAGLVRTFQASSLFPSFTVFRNVLLGLHLQAHGGFFSGLFGPGLRGAAFDALERRAREIIRFTGLEGREHEIAGALSHGYKRILQIAIGLGPQPRLLLLDEPVAGMNHADVDRMMALVRSLRDEQGITIILVEHNMKAVMNVCDRITVVQFGRTIAEGSPAEVAADPAVIAAYLGTFDENVGDDAT